MSLYGRVEPIRSKTQRIPGEWLNPHYTDARFIRASGGLTIFLAEGIVLSAANGTEVEGAHYNYSDTIWHGFDRDLVEQAHDEAQVVVGNKDTAAYYEAMLQRVYQDPTTELQHIVTGVNRSDGYSYQVYGTTSGSSVTR